jgi:hypothetical protein
VVIGTVQAVNGLIHFHIESVPQDAKFLLVGI